MCELGLNCAVYFVAFDVDCRERSGRAEILASAATDTASLVDCRNHRRHFVGLVEFYHRDCAYGAMTLATVAIHPFVGGYAIFLNPNGVANLSA